MELNPGVQTSEFKGKCAVQLLLLASSLAGHGLDEKTSFAAVAAIEAAYMAVRTVLKALHVLADMWRNYRAVP